LTPAVAAEAHAKTLLIEKLEMQLAILRRAPPWAISTSNKWGTSPAEARASADYNSYSRSGMTLSTQPSASKIFTSQAR
jgi:hypothetical protein